MPYWGSTKTSRARRGRRAGLASITAAALTAAALVAAVPASAEVEPGRNLELNHSIDLGVLENWPAGSSVLVEVFRGATINPTTHAVSGGVVIASKEVAFSAPNETVDINHVGGADCWDTASGKAPDVKSGDLMVATVLTGPGGLRTDDVDYNFIRNVQFDENPDGTITGHARGVETNGVFDVNAPIAGGGDLEAGTDVAMEAKRVNAPEEADFAFGAGDIVNGEFTNVAVGGTPGQGELFIDTVDPSGGGTGITVTFRASDPPEQPCGEVDTTALAGSSHTIINQANVGQNMVVGGPRQAGVTVTSLRFAGEFFPVVNDNAAGTWSSTIPASFLQGIAQGTHELRATFEDTALADTMQIRKDTIAPAAPTANPAPGSYQSAQNVTLGGEANSTVRYTTNGTTPSATNGLTAGGPVLVTSTQTLLAVVIDAAGNAGPVATLTYTITGPPPPPPPPPAPPAPVVPIITPVTPGQGPLALDSLVTSSRINSERARSVGIRLVMRLADGTEVVRIRISRRTANGRRLLSTGFKTPSGSGLYRVRQNHRSLRRSLKRPGRYEVEVTPGRSRTDLGTPSVFAFRVVR